MLLGMHPHLGNWDNIPCSGQTTWCMVFGPLLTILGCFPQLFTLQSKSVCVVLLTASCATKILTLPGIGSTLLRCGDVSPIDRAPLQAGLIARLDGPSASSRALIKQGLGGPL